MQWLNNGVISFDRYTGVLSMDDPRTSMPIWEYEANKVMLDIKKAEDMAKTTEESVSDIALMIKGFTIFSFTHCPNKKYGDFWQLVIFNKRWEHDP